MVTIVGQAVAVTAWSTASTAVIATLTAAAGPTEVTTTTATSSLGTRSFLYKLARFLGDVNAVKKGRVGRRVGRRVAGKVTGRGLAKLFR